MRRDTTIGQVRARVFSVRAGRVAPLGPNGVRSGFVKRELEGPATVTELGIEGDEQADLSVHGGYDKAVYGYALSSYATWIREFPQHASLLVPGGLGENLSIDGVDETTVCVGDIVRIGSTMLQVTQPRQPCFKLALLYNDRRMPQGMMKNGRCGWYYRVLEPGQLRAGDFALLQDRPNPDWSIAKFFNLIATRSATRGDMCELAALDGLADYWRRTAFRAIAAPAQ